MRPTLSRIVVPTDGRTAAALAVADALQGVRFATEALREARAGGNLAGREAALAMEIAQGTVRHVLTLEHVLTRVAQFDPARTRPLLRAVLYTAVYQLVWMDRVPVFAAVDRAVALARHHARGWTPGLVNAVLRRLAAALVDRRVAWERLNPRHLRVDFASACALDRPVLPDVRAGAGVVEHLACATGQRAAYFADLVERHGLEWAERIAWASQAVPPTVLQRHALRIGAADFAQRVREQIDPAAAFADDAAFVSASAPVFDAPLFREGLAYVQDNTARAAAHAVGATRGERILDLCAAPGGKSIALALAMADEGAITACDSAASRLRLLDENVARMGLRSVRSRVIEATGAGVVSRTAGGATDPAGDKVTDERVGVASDPAPGGALHDGGTACDAVYDAVLVDAPCSNTGVLARRPEARLGLTRTKLAALVRAQEALLRTAAARVRPGGRLVYSTCSIEPQENEQLVERFLEANPAWSLQVQHTTLPDWGPCLSDWRDGGYYARLTRSTAL